MSKASPPLLGFNNNVRHRGRVFHIQTEDSGVKFLRIVTHLFADGGRIVKTARTDYTEHREKSDMAALVRGLMKEQHKAMFAALRAGELDPLLEEVCGPLDAVTTRADSLLPVDPTATNDLATARVVVGSSLPGARSTAAPQLAPKLPSSSSVAVAPPIRLPEPAATEQAVREGVVALRDSDAPRRQKRSISNPNLRRPTPSVVPPRADAFDLDVASLDKNPPKSAGTPAPPSVRPARKSNPAPRKSRPPIPQRPPPQRGAQAPSPPSASAVPPSLTRPQTGRSSVPQASARSIFGDGAISEQSLDEVILSYLAEDLDESK